MWDTMDADDGAGISACQIGLNLQMFIVNAKASDIYQSNPICFINPEITFYFEETEIEREGCLSFPGLWANVPRSKWIKVQYQDLHGTHQELTASGLFAKVIQHETDHLSGKLFIDLMSNLQKSKVTKDYLKLKQSGLFLRKRP